MMDNIMSTNKIHVTKKFEKLIFRSAVECRPIIAYRTYVMDFIIPQTYLHIHYCIMRCIIQGGCLFSAYKFIQVCGILYS